MNTAWNRWCQTLPSGTTFSLYDNCITRIIIMDITGRCNVRIQRGWGDSISRCSSVPSYHWLIQLSQPRMLQQHFSKIIGGLMGEMWQILHFRESWSRPRRSHSPRDTGVSSNTPSIFLWRRAISLEKSFSTSAQLLDWWPSGSWIDNRLFLLFLRTEAKRSSSTTL